MTRRQFGAVCGPAVSCLGSPSATPNMAVDWADGGGWWSEPSLGSTSSAVCVCAMKSGLTSMKHLWPCVRSPLLEGSAKARRCGDRVSRLVSLLCSRHLAEVDASSSGRLELLERGSPLRASFRRLRYSQAALSASSSLALFIAKCPSS